MSNQYFAYGDDNRNVILINLESNQIEKTIFVYDPPKHVLISQDNEKLIVGYGEC